MGMGLASSDFSIQKTGKKSGFCVEEKDMDWDFLSMAEMNLQKWKFMERNSGGIFSGDGYKYL